MKKRSKGIVRGFVWGDGLRNGVGRESVNLITAVDEDGSQLRSGVAVDMVDEAVLTPVHTHSGNRGVETLVGEESGRGVSRLWVIGSDGVRRLAGAVDGAPLACVSVGSDKMLVSTDRERATLERDGEGWRVRGGSGGRMPSVRAREHSTLTLSTGSLALNLASAGSTSLDVTSERRLSQSLAEGYRQLASTAETAGVWMQPMAVAVRVKDGSGMTVYRSQPMVMSVAGWQCGGELTADAVRSGDTGLTVGDVRAEVRSYVIELTMPSGMADEAKSVEVWALPQHHILDGGAQAPARVVSRSSGVRLRTALPGATNFFGDNSGEWRTQIMVAAAEVMERGRCIGRYETEGNLEKTLTIRATPMASVADVSEMREIVEAAYGRRGAGAGSTSGDVLSQLESGADFVGSVVCSGGGSVVWGDVMLTEGAGMDPAELAAVYDDEYGDEWMAAVTVTYADGGRRVRHYDGSGRCPSAIGPLVTWPSRDAVEWSLLVERGDGRVTGVHVPLTADRAGGSFASYLSAGCEQIELTDSEESIEAETSPRSRRMESMLLISDIENPERAVAAVMCGSGRILSIKPALHSRSAWDVSRERFVAVTGSGIYGVSYSRATRRGSVTLIDGALTERGSQVASTPFGVLTVSSGRLLCVANSRATVACGRLDGTTGVEWHDGLGVVLAVDSNGNLSALEPDAKGRIRRRTLLELPVAPISLCGDGCGGVWIASDRGLHRIGREGRSEAKADVVAESEMETAAGERVGWLTVDMTASDFDGTIVLRGDNGRGPAEMADLLRLRVRGAIDRPVTARVLAPWRRYLRLRVAGTVSADFRLGEARCEMMK